MAVGSKRGRLPAGTSPLSSDCEVGVSGVSVEGTSSVSGVSLDWFCGERLGADGGAEGLPSVG